MHKTLLTAGIFALSLTGQALAGTNAPTITLIPVTAIESIKQSASTAKSMESRLKLVINRIESQKALYDNGKCEGAFADRGCDQIFTTMSGAYKEFLEVLNDELPHLAKQLKVTAKSIETRLRKTLGKGMSPVDIQRMVSGRKGNGKKQLKVRTGNNSHSMVAWLKNIGRVVSTGGHGDTPAVVASDIYVNMTLAAQEVDQIQADISQSLATIDTYNAFGQLSSAQLDTIASVKGMLFGNIEDSALPSSTTSEVELETYAWEESF